MAKPWPHDLTRALVLESLGPWGDFPTILDAVLQKAAERGLYDVADTQGRPRATKNLLHEADRNHMPERVRQVMWSLMVQGIVLFGLDADDRRAGWPYYRLTEHGVKVKQGLDPQPYDPTGFLDYFREKNPTADPVIVAYVAEAVHTFNAGCLKASTVMMGCASEQAVLVLHQAFLAAIPDPVKKQKYAKDTGRASIAHLFDELRDRLGKMVAGKRLPQHLAETVDQELAGMVNLIRRQRNAAGHPELVADHDPDSVFTNLRLVTDHIRRVIQLVEHFRTHDADW